MQYMLLIYSDPAKTPPPGTPEFGQMMAAYNVANQKFIADKVMVSGDALQPHTTATTVRVKGGKTQTLDGPFAETKEMLGGYYILNCKDLDEAIRYAAMIPAGDGAVEVRPVLDLSKLR